MATEDTGKELSKTATPYKGGKSYRRRRRRRLLE